jgi:hypothetical protein
MIALDYSVLVYANRDSTDLRIRLPDGTEVQHKKCASIMTGLPPKFSHALFFATVTAVLCIDGSIKFVVHDLSTTVF